MNVNMSENGGVPAMPMSERMPVMPGLNGALPVAKLLGGASVKVMKGGATPAPDPRAILMSMMTSYFQTLQANAKNLGVSKEVRELRKRKAKEIAERIRDLKERKIDYEQARITFINCVASGDDKAYFEKMMAEMRATVVA